MLWSPWLSTTLQCLGIGLQTSGMFIDSEKRDLIWVPLLPSAERCFSTLQVQMQSFRARNACTRLWGYWSGQDLLLVSPALSQAVCFPSCFFRMPCPLKIFQCMPRVHYLAVHGKTPSARACCECCTIVSQLPPLLICCIISVKAKAMHGTDAWNGIGIQLLHFSNLTSIV